MNKCRYCGYEGGTVCDGIGPRLGCEMPGLRPTYNKATMTSPARELGLDSPIDLSMSVVVRGAKVKPS